MILPIWAVFFTFSLPPSADSIYINITLLNGKQDFLKQPEANTDLVDFLGLIYYSIKALLKEISLYLLSHFRISIILLTCPDNINVILQVWNQPKSHVPAKSHKLHWRKASYLHYFHWNLCSLSVCSCSCEDSRIPHWQLNLNSDIFITEDLYCLKAIDSNFVWIGGNI